MKASTGGDTLAQSYLGAGNDERVNTDVSATITDKQINSPLGIAAYTRFTSGVAGTTTYVTRDPQGGLLGLRVGTGGTATHYYTEADNLGSILKVITATGTVANSYTYDPYGTTTAATGSLLEPFRYTGAYTDTTTGLTKLGARYYDTTLGRFTQTDPQTHPDDVNQSSPYPYASNDPINHTDPTGQFCEGFFSCAGDGAIIGTFVGIAGGFVVGGLAGGIPAIPAALILGGAGAVVGTFIGGIVGIGTDIF